MSATFFWFSHPSLLPQLLIDFIFQNDDILFSYYMFINTVTLYTSTNETQMKHFYCCYVFICFTVLYRKQTQWLKANRCIILWPGVNKIRFSTDSNKNKFRNEYYRNFWGILKNCILIVFSLLKVISVTWRNIWMEITTSIISI